MSDVICSMPGQNYTRQRPWSRHDAQLIKSQSQRKLLPTRPRLWPFCFVARSSPPPPRRPALLERQFCVGESRPAFHGSLSEYPPNWSVASCASWPRWVKTP